VPGQICPFRCGENKAFLEGGRGPIFALVKFALRHVRALGYMVWFVISHGIDYSGVKVGENSANLKWVDF
jgi:hypothetical protein